MLMYSAWMSYRLTKRPPITVAVDDGVTISDSVTTTNRANHHHQQWQRWQQWSVFAIQCCYIAYLLLLVNFWQQSRVLSCITVRKDVMGVNTLRQLPHARSPVGLCMFQSSLLVLNL
jgi:hypothetical protein